jgi:hypothetical protein
MDTRVLLVHSSGLEERLALSVSFISTETQTYVNQFDGEYK